MKINDYDPDNKFINVYILPSPKDAEQTTGLCGNLDGVKDTHARGLEEYYLSWK